MSEVLVVGSLNMDLVVKVDEIPRIGETLLGNELLQIPGGKGANQGVSISKLGNNVTFLGNIGKDSYGEKLLMSLKNAGVNTKYIEQVDGNTGIAVINVDKQGSNNIIVILGANSKVNNYYLHKNLNVFKEADLVLFQLEIPLETVKEGLKISKRFNKITVLNPAPAADLDDEIMQYIDILIPNEYELERISKEKIKDKESMLKAANTLLQKGIKKVIVTLGDKGVLYCDSKEQKIFAPYIVDAVDTTAAGDSFIGGFVSSYIEDKNIEKAIDMGQKTAALTIQKVGAQSSLPTKIEIQSFKWENYK